MKRCYLLPPPTLPPPTLPPTLPREPELKLPLLLGALMFLVGMLLLLILELLFLGEDACLCGLTYSELERDGRLTLAGVYDLLAGLVVD